MYEVKRNFYNTNNSDCKKLLKCEINFVGYNSKLKVTSLWIEKIVK